MRMLAVGAPADFWELVSDLFLRWLGAKGEYKMV